MGIDARDFARLSKSAQKQILEKLDKPAKPSKFGNVKTPRTLENGTEYTFASKREAERFDELMLLLKAGRIRNLKLQPHYTLTAPYIKPNGEKVKREDYVADFEYEKLMMIAHKRGEGRVFVQEWRLVVEDVKGKRTDMYLRKRNQMLDKYDIRVREV